jgi:hypothetical protein
MVEAFVIYWKEGNEGNRTKRVRRRYKRDPRNERRSDSSNKNDLQNEAAGVIQSNAVRRVGDKHAERKKEASKRPGEENLTTSPSGMVLYLV